MNRSKMDKGVARASQLALHMSRGDSERAQELAWQAIEAGEAGDTMLVLAALAAVSFAEAAAKEGVDLADMTRAFDAFLLDEKGL